MCVRVSQCVCVCVFVCVCVCVCVNVCVCVAGVCVGGACELGASLAELQEIQISSCNDILGTAQYC